MISIACVTVSNISENMEERNSIPAMLTTSDFFSLHPQHQYYYSSPTINNTAVDAGIQMSDIYGGVMSSSTYCHQDPRVQQGHQHSSSRSANLDVEYQVGDDQEDKDYELLLAALINNHVVEKKEEEIAVPLQAAAGDDVSSNWEWPRFGGTLESIVDQDPCLVPLTIQHVPDHDGNTVELLEDQEYCHMVPQVVADQIEINRVVQSKHSTCNTEWMTVEEEDQDHDHYWYPTSHNTTPPPPPSYQYSQRGARKIYNITEKRQMQRGKSSTATINSSSTNKRSKATILHNKSERQRRGKINERLETLQKLLPSFHKTDKVSMLDQVIEYVKKLQTQNDQMKNMRLGMFDNNNMPVAVHPTMMMPHYITTVQAMQQQQQQQQMSMISQMSMGMSTNPAGLVMMPTGSIVHPNMRQE